MWEEYLQQIEEGNTKTLARVISLVENEYEGFENLLQLIPQTSDLKTIGITGPPGAGKSTLVDALLNHLVNTGKKIAVLCIDPSSPFNLGALLGDRIRMSDWYNHPNVFIRSLASRGSVGGLHPRIIEITDVLKAAPFDYIIVETVGVGQTEIEIAGLADTTVVVTVPESGDEIQTMKAGLMEIADVFVVNKADRPGADLFVKNLRLMLAPVFASGKTAPAIIKTTAHQKEGIAELWDAIQHHLQQVSKPERKYWLLTEKVFYLMQQQRMSKVNKSEIKKRIEQLVKNNTFNLYQFVATFKEPGGK